VSNQHGTEGYPEARLKTMAIEEEKCPVRTYRRVAVGVLFLSFIPDILLATSHDMGGGWSEAFFSNDHARGGMGDRMTLLPGVSMTSHSETAAKPDRPLSIL
jgi:hypothetical protein